MDKLKVKAKANKAEGEKKASDLEEEIGQEVESAVAGKVAGKAAGRSEPHEDPNEEVGEPDEGEEGDETFAEADEDQETDAENEGDEAEDTDNPNVETPEDEGGLEPDDGQEAGEEDEDEGEEQDVRDVWMIHQAKCLKCIHLIGGIEVKGARAFDSCHYTNGNDNCPAAAVRIVVGVNVGRVSSLIAEATLIQDVPHLAELYAKLSEKDPIVRADVMKAVQEKLSDPDWLENYHAEQREQAQEA